MSSPSFVNDVSRICNKWHGDRLERRPVGALAYVLAVILAGVACSSDRKAEDPLPLHHTNCPTHNNCAPRKAAHSNKRRCHPPQPRNTPMPPLKAPTPPAKNPDAQPPQKTAPNPANQGPPTNLQVLPKKWSRKKVSSYMKKVVSRGLGVKCSYCHDTTDYAADNLSKKKIARQMMRMVSAINRSYFKGKSSVTCHSCHVGNKKP